MIVDIEFFDEYSIKILFISSNNLAVFFCLTLFISIVDLFLSILKLSTSFLNSATCFLKSSSDKTFFFDAIFFSFSSSFFFFDENSFRFLSLRLSRSFWIVLPLLEFFKRKVISTIEISDEKPLEIKIKKNDKKKKIFFH